MTKAQKQALMSVTLVTVLILIDQLIKIYVKTHFYLGEDIQVMPWFHLIFVENNGMAFGMEFFGKLFLTGFRFLAIVFIIWYMIKRIRTHVGNGYLFVLSLVLAGAIGNLVDCFFYGEIFSASAYTPFQDTGIAHFVPYGQGYGTIFQGLVVDMFQFPLFDFNWPEWIPIIGGKYFLFFSPIFNFADACISCGIVSLILFFRKELSDDKLLGGEKKDDASVTEYIG